MINNVYRFRNDVAINHTNGTIYITYDEMVRLTAAFKLFKDDIEDNKFHNSTLNTITINEEN